jgi:hypothetical protein
MRACAPTGALDVDALRAMAHRRRRARVLRRWIGRLACRPCRQRHAEWIEADLLPARADAQACLRLVRRHGCCAGATSCMPIAMRAPLPRTGAPPGTARAPAMPTGGTPVPARSAARPWPDSTLPVRVHARRRRAHRVARTQPFACAEARVAGAGMPPWRRAKPAAAVIERWHGCWRPATPSCRPNSLAAWLGTAAAPG